MHLGKDSTKMDGDRGKNSTQEKTKIAIIFPQSQLHLQKKKRYKHIIKHM